MKWIARIALLLLVFFGCDKKHPFKQSDDFNTLMGLNKSVWKFVETHEDYENLGFFKKLYETNKNLQLIKEDQKKIPKVIHFIWLGPNPFPKESVGNIDSWIKNHPNWTVKFWTDRYRPLPNKKMELQFIANFTFDHVKDCYENSDNYAEKADILRYELLFKEGGVYVDHDVECFNSFESFHNNYDLYCGLEPPHEPILSSSISVCNNVIGSLPGHPVLKKTIENVKAHWKEVALAYPGTDKESVIYRVAQRTFAAFDHAVRQEAGKKNSKDIVLPAAYFNRIDGDLPLYAHHHYASTWFEGETNFEKNVRRRLVAISRKNNQLLLLNGVILTLNLALFLCLFLQYRSIKKNRSSSL
ncbi:MAG: glycosyltransferase [Simkaniaceae bacterium]|nr:glycosyltransferase [Simkaniaceae bacterium]